MQVDVRHLHIGEKHAKTKERIPVLLVAPLCKLSLSLWNPRDLWIGSYCLLLTAVCLLIWWRRRELNPDPKANAEGLYMLSRFSFLRNLAALEIFARFQLSETTRRWNGLVRL